MKKVLFFLILICNFVGRSQSNLEETPYKKQISFRHLSVKDGLSQSSVVSIAQDSIGYLWFATQDGLNRYQGHAFEYHNKQYQDITRSNYAQLGQLYTDTFGDLWSYASDEIIERYDYANNSFHSQKTVKNATVFFRKSKHQLWLGTLDNGILALDLHTNSTSKIAGDILNTVSVFDIKKFDEAIYLATSKGLYKIDDKKTIKHYSKTTHLAISTLEQREGLLFLGTFNKGLKVLDFSQDAIVDSYYDNIPSVVNIQDIFLDSKHRLWLATYGNGLYLIQKNDEVLHFKANKEDPHALHYNDILKIYEDQTGNIWFGSDGGGLSFYDEHLVKFNIITNKQVPEGIHVDVVRAITLDTIDQIWLGTSGKGLTRLNHSKKEYKTYTTKNSALSSNRIMSLLYDEGELWIGHQATGLQRLKSNDLFENFSSLTNLVIWKIYKGDSNTYWLCTGASGLLKINREGIIQNRYTMQNSALTTNNIRTVEKGAQNELWIGSEEGGLFRLNTSNQQIQKIETLSYKIKALTYVEGSLWIGTNGYGLKKLEPTTLEVTNFEGDYKLPNNVVYSILPDDKNNFWISTNKGISRFTLEHPRKQYVEDYTLVNGLQAYEFNTGAYFKSNDGHLYFGGIEGINWFDPSNVSYNKEAPKNVISKFEVNNKPYNTNVYHELEHDNNTVTFTFAGLHFSHPEKNLYRYKLEGLEDSWTVPAYSNTARYNSLPPNDYTFKVTSSNYEGLWNKKPKTYSFSILKPWYASHLAYSIYSLLLLLLLYLIYRYFKFRWKMNTQLQLEHAEAERLQNLDEFKTKLYTNISHEFRTPLTLISGPINHLLDKKHVSKEDKKELSLVQNNADRLLYLVNQMMDLSMLDAGHLSLKVSQGNLSILISQLVASFRYQAKKKQLTLNANVIDTNQVWFDPDVVEKIISNLLSNGIKYTQEKGTIWLKTSLQNNYFLITVINTYNYLSHKNLEQLFERFYQGENSAEGVGVGLALVKELVELSHGTIVASTLDDKRIQFSVTLPVSKDAFLETELNVKEFISEKKLKDVATEIEADANVLLIVDDEPQIRQFISSIFKDEYSIIESKNGDEGIVKAINNIPDLIISDVMMPGSDGIALCNALKNDTRTSHIPIILLTAKVGSQPELEGLKSGADAYITKPFVVKNLKTRVAKLIETRKQLQEQYSKEFKIDTNLTISEPDALFAEQLEKVLSEHITDTEFSASKFSKAMLMSRMQLHRKLKALFGITTSDFIRKQRLKLAISLLKESTSTISEIGYAVGFNSPSYFMKCFKENYGCTPSEYMNNSH